MVNCTAAGHAADDGPTAGPGAHLAARLAGVAVARHDDLVEHLLAVQQAVAVAVLAGRVAAEPGFLEIGQPVVIGVRQARCDCRC